MFRQPRSPRVDNKGTHQGFIDKSAESSTQQQNANTPLVDIPSYFSGGKVNLTKYQPGGLLPKAQEGFKVPYDPETGMPSVTIPEVVVKGYELLNPIN